MRRRAFVGCLIEIAAAWPLAARNRFLSTHAPTGSRRVESNYPLCGFGLFLLL